ncbi:HU family DNA-binding protein [Ferrimonas lipolytica]|uniref:HU family DNA-binding protein n=2 Tax=Ferrimonas lipolytica TaxID=2724191 RepID=A0A6H1UBW9_9GAMM|nr:HU family DNA-binding protein [Ferrimonas lipolytica]
MNRTQLIKRMAQLSDLPQTTCKATLTQLEAVICKALHEGETVYLPKLGVFEIRHHLPRSGRNPQTGAEIQIPLRTVAAFKPASQLKQAVSG